MNKQSSSTRSRSKGKRSKKRNLTNTPGLTNFSVSGGTRLNTDNYVSKLVRSAYFDTTVPVAYTYSLGLSFNVQGFYAAGSFTSWAGGATDLSAAYDFYRIDRVEITFLFSQNQASTSTYVTALPYAFGAIDYNDATVTGNFADISQRSTCSFWRLDKPFKVNFTPRAQLGTYSGGVNSAYSEAPLGAWFNSNSTNTPLHYGYKMVIDSTDMSAAAGTLGNMRIFVKCFFSAKEPK